MRLAYIQDLRNKRAFIEFMRDDETGKVYLWDVENGKLFTWKEMREIIELIGQSFNSVDEKEIEGINQEINSRDKEEEYLRFLLHRTCFE